MTMAVASLIFTGVAAASQVIGGMQQASATEAQAEANAAAERERAGYNTRLVARAARDDLDEADRASRSELAQERERQRRLLATQRVQAASSGFAGGTLLDIYGASEAAALADLQTLRENQAQRRRSILTRRDTDIAGIQYGAETSAWAGLTSARLSARNTRSSAIFSAIGTVAGGSSLDRLTAATAGTSSGSWWLGQD